MVKQAFAAFSMRQCRRDFVRHVQLVRQSLALVACVRRAMDGSAHQVCAPVLRFATFGRAQVRAQA